MNFKKNIKNKAREIGFDLVGITTAEPFPDTYKNLEERKDNNKLPQFLSTRDLKLLTTPKLLLPAANSIISLGISYATLINKKGIKISRYALGRDYHKVVKNKMNKLSLYIQQLVSNIEIKSFTDTGPVLEREIARRAGLGWIGKNNNLINKKYGSYLFLGEILTSLKLKSDSPEENFCVNCQLCIEACPGEALVSPYNCEFDRCRSYLTQKKGVLTNKEREIIGESFWGCDVCQEVCPYNRDVPVNLHPEFNPRLERKLDELVKILNFSKRNLPSRWQEAPLTWRGLRILKRNLIIVIGNSKKKKYLSFIEPELNNSSPIIRLYAVWALGKINNNLSSEKLQNLLKNENDERVIKEINKLL